mmetsp:Transcript_56723/g.101143  ORF Transcript_56723/g.101143 Transcript_56723/m.101143 type:complete len:495 (-) Transcript_56723:1586-3070(-)
MSRSPPRGGKPSFIFHVAEQGDHETLKQILSKDKTAAYERNEDKETPLHIACKHCYFICVEVLLKFGAYPDAPDKDGKTPLHVALAFGTSQMLPMLLRYGADPTKTDNTGMNAVHIATFASMPKVVEELMTDQSQVDDQPCMCNECLWKSKADLRSPGLHHRGHQKPMPRRKPLDLLKLVKEPDAKKNLPLHFAAGDPACAASALQFLDVLKDKAKKSEQIAVCDMKNDDGYCALQYAAYTGLAEVVADLLEIGAKPDVLTPGGQTILQIACEAGDLDTTNTIINTLEDAEIMKTEAFKTLLNHADETGNTALHYACRGGHLSCVRALFRQVDHLDIGLENKKGQTSLMIALMCGYPQIVAILEENGANVKAAKAAVKGRNAEAAALKQEANDRSAVTIAGPGGKILQRAEAKGEGAIPKKSYLLHWILTLVFLALSGRYCYNAFQEYAKDYPEEVEYYKEQCIKLWHATVRVFWACVAYLQNLWSEWNKPKPA